MQIRFTNTTTIIPFTESDLKYLNEIITEPFCKQISASVKNSEFSIYGEKIDVFFVNEEEMNRDRNQVFVDNFHDEELKGFWDRGMDLLGIYVSQSSYLRPIIKICPEKILRVCTDYQEEHNIQKTYPALLSAVVIHELGHFLMDFRAYDRRASWKKSEIFPLESTQFKNFPTGWTYPAFIIEESLANAFILEQNYKGSALEFLNKFIESQPPGYKYAKQWIPFNDSTLTCSSWDYHKEDGGQRKPRDLLAIALSWKIVKSLYVSKNFASLSPQNPDPLKFISDKLCRAEYLVGHDFKEDFINYLISNVDSWENQYKGCHDDEEKHMRRKILYGKYGVFYEIFECNSLNEDEKNIYKKRWDSNFSINLVNGDVNLYDRLSPATKKNADKLGMDLNPINIDEDFG